MHMTRCIAFHNCLFVSLFVCLNLGIRNPLQLSSEVDSTKAGDYLIANF